MDLTRSFERVIRQPLLARYEFYETRNAAAVLAAAAPARFAELLRVLDGFELLTDDLIRPGGNESRLAGRLNRSFRDLGWREARVDTLIKLRLIKQPYRSAGETQSKTSETNVANEGYMVDNFVDRVALDVEWNAKDGNLDRDLAAYRALYESALIDGAVMITRTHRGLRDLGYRLGLESGMPPARARLILNTSTTTNTTKLVPRMQRGDSGGCPLLVAAICERTWEGADTPS